MFSVSNLLLKKTFCEIVSYEQFHICKYACSLTDSYEVHRNEVLLLRLKKKEEQTFWKTRFRRYRVKMCKLSSNKRNSNDIRYGDVSSCHRNDPLLAYIYPGFQLRGDTTVSLLQSSFPNHPSATCVHRMHGVSGRKVEGGSAFPYVTRDPRQGSSRGNSWIRVHR